MVRRAVTVMPVVAMVVAMMVAEMHDRPRNLFVGPTSAEATPRNQTIATAIANGNADCVTTLGIHHWRIIALSRAARKCPNGWAGAGAASRTPYACP